MSRPLECCTILLMCQMSLNELWNAMGGLNSTSTTHSKPSKAAEDDVVATQSLIARHSEPRMT